MTQKQSNAVALATTADGLPDYSDQAVLAVIRDQAARNCTDAELGAALHLAKAYGLDFLAKEVWAVKRNPNDAALTVVSREGYRKIARRQPSFAGLASSAVHEGDVFEVNPVTAEVRHTYGLKRGALVAAYAVVTRNDGVLPTVAVVYLAEQKGNSPIWAKYPAKMLVKCAEVDAIKGAFGLSGIVPEDDLDGESFGQAPEDATASVPTGALSGVKRQRKAADPMAKVEVVDVVAPAAPLAPEPEAPPAPVVVDAEFEDVPPPATPEPEAAHIAPEAPAAPPSHLPDPAEFKAWLAQNGLAGPDVKAVMGSLAKDDPTFPAKMGDTTPEQFVALENALIIIAQERKGA